MCFPPSFPQLQQSIAKSAAAAQKADEAAADAEIAHKQLKVDCEALGKRFAAARAQVTVLEGKCAATEHERNQVSV